MLNLIIGLILGSALTGIYFYFALKREWRDIDEEHEQIAHEKQVVVDFMHNMVEAIGTGVNRRDLFDQVVHTAILSTRALSACAYERSDEKKLFGVAIEGLFPPQRLLGKDAASKEALSRTKFIEQVLKSESIEVGEGVIGEVARTGEGELIENAEADPRLVQHEDPSLKLRSMIAVPIWFRDRILGVLAVANPADGKPFGVTDYYLLESLAEQAGLAIHNADLMNVQIEKSKLDNDLALAENIQRMLLPDSTLKHELLDVNARYRPAQKVGGDLFDILPLEGGKVGIAVADVSGKGIPASLHMAMCFTHLHHYVKMSDSPAQVLREMNSVMHDRMPPEMFITLVYAIVDPERNQIVFARAGHESPLLCSKVEMTDTYRTQKIKAEGMALGMVPPAIFDGVISDTVVEFVPGDVFVLYTDGITEALNDEGTEYSAGRLADAIKMHRNRTAKEMNRAILEGMTRFVGFGRQADDITLVTVKFRQTPAGSRPPMKRKPGETKLPVGSAAS